jgi:hypothetical protein
MLVEVSLDLLGTLLQPNQPAVAIEVRAHARSWCAEAYCSEAMHGMQRTAAAAAAADHTLANATTLLSAALQLCRGILGPVLNLMLASDDPSELNSAVQLLLQLLRCCPTADFLACNTASSSSSSSSSTTSGPAAADGSAGVLPHLLAVTRQLLSPLQPDSCSFGAGALLVQLLKTFQQQLSGPVPAAVLTPGNNTAPSAAAGGSCVGLLLHDVAVKLGSGACSPATVSSLLEFVVRLVLLDAQQLLELLANMQLQKPGGCGCCPDCLQVGRLFASCQAG